MKALFSVFLIFSSISVHAGEARLQSCIEVGEYAGFIHSMRSIGVRQNKALIELKATKYAGFASDPVAIDLIELIYTKVPQSASVSKVESFFTRSCLKGE